MYSIFLDLRIDVFSPFGYRSGYFAVTGNAIISVILPSLYDLRTLRLLHSSILQFLDLDFRRHFVLNLKKKQAKNR